MRFPVAFVWLSIGACLASVPSLGQEPDKLRSPASLSYSWTVPTDGTPVVSYVVEVKINGEVTRLADPVFETTVTLMDVEYLHEYQIRVAGVDAEGHQGPFSLWSEPFSPELEAPEF